MDPLFSRMTKRYVPAMNRDIMEGFACKVMKDAERFLDSQIRSICQGLPPSLRYMGYSRCSPQEEYDEITRLRSNRRVFDLAHSSVYFCKYYFEFTDPMGTKHSIVRYIHLLYVTRGGLISISGSTYHIIPVLSDKVFTPSMNSIFVRLTQDRNYMYRIYNTIVINNKYETRYVAWATIHGSQDAKNSGKSTRRAKTLLVHYLFGRHGFTKAFEKYAGFVPVFGYGDDINPEKYPPDQWKICQSRGLQPKNRRDEQGAPTTIRLAIPNDRWNKAIETLVFGFFYVADRFADRFNFMPPCEETIDADGVIHRKELPMTAEARTRQLDARLNDRSLWMILVGLILFGDLRGENVLYKEMVEHFDSLDDYLDTEARRKLEEKHIHLNDYYDLLFYIAENFDTMLKDNFESEFSVYGKNLEILGPVFYDILHGFTSMKFALSKSANRRPLSYKSVLSNFQQFIKPGKIFMIHSGKIITKLASSSTDHLYPSITSVLVEQESRAGPTRGQKRRVVVGPQHRLELSMVDVGSVLNLPKANPTPLAKVNPWVNVEEATGTVIPNPKLVDIIEANRKYFKF